MDDVVSGDQVCDALFVPGGPARTETVGVSIVNTLRKMRAASGAAPAFAWDTFFSVAATRWARVAFSRSTTIRRRCAATSADLVPCAPCACYLTSVSILNIGRYIEMMMMPTMTPTPIIMIGSTIDVSDCTAESTSSS